MSRSPVYFSIHVIHGHVEGHKLVNSSDLLVLFLLPHFVVVLLFDAPSHKATLKVFAYLLVDTIVKICITAIPTGPQGPSGPFQFFPTPRPLTRLRDEPPH